MYFSFTLPHAGVTQTTYFFLLTHVKQLSLVTFCDTIAEIGKKWKSDVRTDVQAEGQADVKSEIVILINKEPAMTLRIIQIKTIQINIKTCSFGQKTKI